ncbi:MAG: amino acid adenylation domain-containing protein, partial [Myxococcaceae bacterium]
MLKLDAQEHVLVLHLHHIVSDGWSLGVLVREMTALYEAFRLGQAPALPELPVQYADYAVWQRDWLQGEALDSQLGWWKQQLAGAPHALDLPTDKPRPAVATRRGDAVPVHLSRALAEKVEALAQLEGATPFMVLLAAFQTLLHRYSGQDDVLVGSPIANRHHAETEGLIGFFVNTLVLRGSFSARPSFRQLIAQVRTTTLGAYEHQDIPFERLVESLQTTRDLSRTPLFQAMFALQNAPLPELVLPGLSVKAADIGDRGTSQFELSLSLDREADGFDGQIHYATDLFERSTVERLMTHLRVLLETALEQPDAPLADLSFVPPEERQRLLGDLGGTVADFDRDATLHGRIEAQVARTPDADAVAFEGTTLSFRQLDARANQLARHLRSLGVGPEVTVGLCMERSVESIVALLAVLKAGGAFVPIDPSSPVARRSFILGDSRASVLLTTQALADEWTPEVGTVVCLDGEQKPWAELSPEAPASGAGPENLAYVLYTSGSTGMPKGVAVQHRSVLHLHQALSRDIYVQPQRGLRVSVNAPLFFDGSIKQVIQLLSGYCLCVVPGDTRKDPEAMLTWLETQRIDALDCTPSLLKLLLNAGLLERAHVPALILIGGEALDAVTWQRLSTTKRTRAFNVYGPTETTVNATTWSIQDASQVLPVIGRPLDNVRAYILDERQRLVPFGMQGELCLSGQGVTRGYLGRPDLTAERFVSDPFSTEPGARLYRTGDKARWREDGTLDFIGRLDFQVKLRGYRIELGEIEATLRSHPGLRDAVVLLREDVPGDARLVAYVAPEMDTPPLREHLRKHLPEYMVPAAVMALPVLPLTPNGKVDRKALPVPEASQLPTHAYVAPETPTEVALAALWSEVLHVPAVGRHDNFFELGGHSLLATQVVSRIRSTLGVELPLGDLFRAPTVAELAERLAHAARSKTPALTRADRTSAPPLSFAQQRLWFIDQLEPGTTLYNMPLPLRLTGAVDEGALRKSLDALMARHEVLRTVFRVEAGQPVQHIHAEASVPFESVDLTGIADATERQAEAARRGSAEFRRPFNLEQGPVIRALLLKLGAEDHVLVLHVHHIVSDGWSLGVIVREMTTLYEAFRQGQTPSLPELPVQYADYALWQRGWLQGEALDSQLGWWKQQLSGAPHVLDLPTDKPRPAVISGRGDAVPVHLPRVLSEKVEALAQKEGATPFMVLLAAFQTVLHRYSAQDDVLVGSPIANRHHAETEGLIGFFVNTLVLRGSFSARPSFRQLVAQVRTTTLGAYEHQDLPFERLVESLQATRDLSRTPLFQVMFALQNAPRTELVLPGLALQAADIGARGLSQFELSLDLGRATEGFVGRIDYATDLFERSTVERLIQHLRVLLEAVLERPDAPLADLSFVGTEERQRLLGDLSGTVADFDRESTLHGRIEAQVARTPNADAVEFEGTTLSFRQLDARANQLARHLRSLGVGAEVTVGLCLERSVESIVALLAVLKAGGAFVPLDPKAPAARRSFILEDSRASVLLTTQALADEWTPEVGTVVCLDGEQKPWKVLSAEALASSVRPENLAYVLYTSGSTGMPKGVAVLHRSVLHLHQAMSRDIYVQPQRGLRVSLNAPLFFDASMEQLIQLVDGYCLCIVPEGTRKDPEAMIAWLETQRIDSLDCTPSQLKLLLDAGLLEREHVPALLIIGGEALDEVTWRRLSTTKRTRAFNVYGPTETTVNATAWALQDAAQVLPVIGRPLDNVRAYILDEQQHLVPFGMQGELCLAGEGLARGYLGRPDLTAERFVPHPFSTEPGARLYRTGDKARWREDGTLDFMGRLDFQVKLRGYRIELGEIEATLRSYPGLRDAVVLVREDVPGNARLIAYVAPEVETAPLREHLRKHLPEYMVPAVLVALPVLPLTPNGKVDRKALPVPEASQLGANTYVAPETPTEVALAALWSEVLRVPSVGRHDNFFELGGHSLLATQVVSRIRSTLGVELPLGDLFRAPTVAGLAERLAHAGRSKTPALTRADRTSAPPLSFAQQRMWFIDQLAPGTSLYNMPLPLRLSGALDEGALRQSLDALMARHESLRTTFRVEAGQPVQHIHAEASMPFESVDLTDRALLLKLDAQEHVLVLHLHHIVSDGWSLGVLVREMTALYEAFRQGQTPSLPELPVQYADYAVWQRNWLQGEALEEQLGWWKQQLAGAPHVLDLPTDKPRPAVATRHGDAVPVHLPRVLSEKVEALAQREGATPFMVLLAAFQTVLHRYSAQDDVLVGSPIANRHHAETEGLIGFFVNTLVLRGSFSARPSFRQLIAQVRTTTLGAYEHQDLPFERLVESLQTTRDLSRTPLFQVMFALQNSPVPELVLPGLSVAGAHFGGRNRSLFELNLDLSRAADGFVGRLDYATDLFERSTVERLMTHLRVLLEAALEQPDAPLADLSFVSPEERQRLLGELGGTVADFDREATLHGRIEAQVARTPDADAVAFEGTTLSFRQLDTRANQLARHLRSLGVGPEVTVGLCLERSVESIVALLAVLKAGGAFVPIDPSSPVARRSFILGDSRASVLLTTQALAEEWTPEVGTVVCLDGEQKPWAELSPEAPASGAGPENLAYVLYTSGSTGMPKGVAV